jgi:hypothetical protein
MKGYYIEQKWIRKKKRVYQAEAVAVAVDANSEKRSLIHLAVIASRYCANNST